MRNLRYVVRSLLRARAFTAAAVVCFAVGFGVNLATFASLDRVLFRALPYYEPHRLVFLRMCADGGTCGAAFPSVVAFEGRSRLSTLEDIGAVAFAVGARMTREQTGEPDVSLSEVSGNLLDVLGVRPIVGRDVNAEDERLKRRVALLSFESWMRRFGGSGDILRQELWVGSRPVSVVGVLPPGFILPSWAAPNPAWEGLIFDPSGLAAIKPEGSLMVPVARLAPGATIDAAQAELTALMAALNPPPADPGEHADRVRVDLLQSTLFSRSLPYFRLVAVAAVLLLVLACANLSTLLLARGRARVQEIAIASALGASHRRLMSDALAETLLVCAAGAVMGFGVLWATQTSLAAVLPPLIARYAVGAIDARVAVTALLVVAVCTVVAGLVPALRASRVDVLPLLRASSTRIGGGRLRGSATLIAIQAALGSALVISALLVLGSFRALSGDLIGFNPDRLYSLEARFEPASDRAAGLARYQQLLALLGEVPRVRAVGGSDAAVGSGSMPYLPFARTPRIEGGRFEVTANYFDVLQTPFVAGRAFTEAEAAARAPVAILSVSGVRTVWPGLAPEEAVDRPLGLDGESRTVIGVVADLKRTFGGEVRPALYVPLGAGPTRYPSAVFRMDAGAIPDYLQLRRRIEERLGPVRRLSLSYVPTTLDSTLQDPRFRAILFGVLAISALLLCAVGLYAVASFEVRQREYELGVRLSLGAEARDLQRLILVRACRPVLAGLPFGLLASFWTSRFLQAFLYEMPARHAGTYAAVAVILVAVAVAAAWLPGRRAASLDPATVLRAH